MPGEHVPIEVNKVHQTLGTVYLTTMFLWMLYRAKEDGLVVLVRAEFFWGGGGCSCVRDRARNGVHALHSRSAVHLLRSFTPAAEFVVSFLEEQLRMSQSSNHDQLLHVEASGL